MRWALLILFWALPAQAEFWSWAPSDASERGHQARWRFSGHMQVWVGTYDRPSSACKAPESPFVGEPLRLSKQALRPAQFDFFCNHDASDEVGLGFGGEVAFKAVAPLYLTAGLDWVYTSPDSSYVRKQVVVGVPFGLLLTWYRWTFRPFLHAQITPVLYLTDGTRDYTMGLSGGFALRLVDFGDLSLKVGYHGAETLQLWVVQIGIHPIL